MFEQVVADQHVEGGVRQRNPLHVEMQLRQRTLQIGRRIVSGLPPQPFHQAHLGSDMQNPLRSVEQIGLARKIKPQQAMPLQRQARRTKGVGA